MLVADTGVILVDALADVDINNKMTWHSPFRDIARRRRLHRHRHRRRSSCHVLDEVENARRSAVWLFGKLIPTSPAPLVILAGDWARGTMVCTGFHVSFSSSCDVSIPRSRIKINNLFAWDLWGHGAQLMKPITDLDNYICKSAITHNKRG
jgi:hypothetical protein